jgi:clan AA aspartic protease (TIGR02281 family)
MGWRPLLLLFILGPALALADQIVLKNGRALQGIIQSEDPAELTLDFGYGTTTLQKADIKFIRRSNAKQRQALKRRFLGQAARSGAIAPPPGSEELSRLLEAARRSREGAQDALREREQLLGGREELQAQERELKSRQPALAAALAAANPNDRRDYNDLVGRVNALGAQIQADVYQGDEASRRLEAGEAAVTRYVSGFAALRRYADANLKRLQAGAQDEAARVFFADVSQELADMARDFKREAVRSQRVGEHLVVGALFNDKVRAPLLVDTGASQTVISPRVAAELGLEGGQSVHTILADGKQVDGKLIVLDSLTVGGARVEKTPVVVLAAPGPQAEGLLGMSFLKNFMVQLDLADSKLILEGLAPAAAKP